MILITALFCFLGVLGKKKKKPKCEGMYEGNVVNLCKNGMPRPEKKKDYEKIWLIQYYLKYQSQIKNLLPEMEGVAEALKEEENFAVGAVDCANTQNADFCRDTEKVRAGWPVFRAFYQGKTKELPKKKGKEITKDSLLEFIRAFAEKQGSKGGSAKCDKGYFPNSAKDAVVPFCRAHFPGEKSKNTWIVIFYNHIEYEDAVPKLGNRFAMDLGNEPPEKSKNAKKVMTQRKRIKNLIEKYELKGINAKGASKSSEDPLMKVGGVCCNCGETDEDKADYAKFCTEKVGGEKWKEAPTFMYTDGTKILPYDGSADEEELLKFAFTNLGLVEKEKTEL